MSSFKPRDPDYGQRVTDCFQNGSASSLWGGQLVSAAPGRVEISLPLRDSSIFPPEFPLRGYVAGLLDDACLLAGLSLTSVGDQVRMAEYKLNFLATATGERLIAKADVVRPGRTITVCRADALVDGQLAARMLATLTVSRSG